MPDWLPYERGEVLTGTGADFAKLRAAWTIMARRSRIPGPPGSAEHFLGKDGGLFDFTGLVRSLQVEDEVLDDELSPALYGERLTALALEHLGGVPGRDDVFVANRTTAALVAAMQVLVRPGSRVVGVSPSYTHPAGVRAVRLAGGAFEDGGDPAAGADLVLLTRLAVTYELLPDDELVRDFGAPVFLDDAGGARVGPAVFGQPRALELDVEAAVTGLDKYGTTGPRLGLLAGRTELVGEIRARAIELGLEARPMLYAAVVRSLERYRPERVRALVAATSEVGQALEERLGSWVTLTPVAVRLEGEATLAEALRRAGLGGTSVVPIEATAALAMVLLRDHGILTVHFAAVPPGTAALLLKFVPPETLERFGGATAFARAVDESLDEVARVLSRPGELLELLAAR
jgi:L-seryl-tRNA(Ser) seleniumtransferase